MPLKIPCFPKDIRAERTFGVKPLKKAPIPSVLIISLMIAAPPTFELKLAFWIRVLTTSRGAATVMDATAPATDATKSGFGVSAASAWGWYRSGEV